MNTRVTAAIVGAFALLAALVFGLERFKVGQPAGTSPTPDASLQVFQFDDRQVTAVTARAGERTVAFAKTDDVWTIQENGRPANRSILSSLLIRMAGLRGTRRVEATDLAQFGLAEPRTEVTATLQDGSVHALQLGGPNPTGTGTYARKPDGSDVFLIATTFAGDVERLVTSPEEPPTPTPAPKPAVTPSPTP